MNWTWDLVLISDPEKDIERVVLVSVTTYFYCNSFSAAFSRMQRGNR